jgi:hypothetical protein
VGICDSAYSQLVSIQREEDKLVKLYAAAMDNLGHYDSMTYYTGKFGEELKKYITSTPFSLNYPFKKLRDSNYCDVATSADGNLRIYSWDTWQGGTMHFFNQIIQYRSGGHIFTKIPQYEEGDPGTFCSAIYTVWIRGIAYYLPISNGIGSTKDASQSISVLAIHDGELIDTVQLFRTKTEMLHSIDVYYDFFSVVDRPERPVVLITYDDKHKVLRIALVKDNGQVTNRNLLYKLGDHCFIFKGIESAKRR